MIQTQYARFKGTPLNFKASDPILGNVSHFSQPLLLSVAAGQIELTLQQMMVHNALGQMEPLSADMQMNADGQVEMVYPSEKITQILEPGNLVEIRPGCAYALNPLTDGILIQYLLPLPYETPLFGTTIGPIELQPIDDSIHFELIKNKTVITPQPTSIDTERPTTPILPSELDSEPTKNDDVSDAIQPSETDAVETVAKTTPVVVASNSNQQRFFYREPSTAMLRIGMFFTMPFILLIFLANMWSPIIAILWLIGTVLSGYWCALNAIPHFRNEPTLSIETDGLMVNNRTYQNLKLDWSSITQIRLDARTTSYENAELVLIIDVADPKACIPNLNILQRKWFKQLQINDPNLPAPAVKLSSSDVDMELNELKAIIDSARN